MSPVGNSGKEMYTTVIYPTGETDGAPQVCLPGEILAERAGEGEHPLKLPGLVQYVCVQLQ